MKYLGVDWGLKRIGLAISEGEISSPTKILQVRGLRDALKQLSEYATVNQVEQIVIGKPEGKMGKIVENVSAQLRNMGLNVNVIDETLSTRNATGWMVKLGVRIKARRKDDAQAAAIILQNYLDETS